MERPIAMAARRRRSRDLSALALGFLSLQAFSCAAEQRAVEAPTYSHREVSGKLSSDWYDPPEVQTCPGGVPCGDDVPDGGEGVP